MIRSLSVASILVLLSGCTGLGPVAINTQSPIGAESGVGGTGFTDTTFDGDEGVGGTGISFETADADEGVGGTGIFGIISAFGSIVVNGVHIDYEPETPVSVDGEKGTPADFAIGQLVAVEAQPMGERYQARTVEIQHAVVGPVSESDFDARTITVLGQVVKVRSSDRLPAVGEWVRVSGLRDIDEHVVATRIDAALSAGDALVRGIISPADGDAFALGYLRLTSTQMPHEGLSLGDEVLVRGRFGAEGFTVKDFRKEPALPFGGRMQDLLIEGYMAPDIGGGARVAGHAWLMPATVVELVQERHQVDGAYLPLLMKGNGANADWVVEESSLPPWRELNGPMPWRLEQEGLRPGSLPDLLRDMPGHGAGTDRENHSTIDPTNLPDASQISAALSAKGLPAELLNMSQPLSEEQLSAILTLGGADLEGEGPITFDPSLLKAVFANKEQFDFFVEGGGLPEGFDGPESAGGSELFRAFQEMQGVGLDPSKMQMMLRNVDGDVALMQGLVQVHFRMKEAGFDASMLPPGLDASMLPPGFFDHIEDAMRANGNGVNGPP